MVNGCLRIPAKLDLSAVAASFLTVLSKVNQRVTRRVRVLTL